MSETIDPLLFLREYIIHNKPIQIIDKHLDFNNGMLRLPLDTQTAYQSRDKKRFYTLGSLFFMVLNRETKNSDYCREAARLNIPQISFLDKPDIISYFIGKTAECSQIDTSMRAHTLVKKSDIRMGKTVQVQQSQMQRKREAKADVKATASEEVKQMQVSDWLAQNEKKIHSRATVI